MGHIHVGHGNGSNSFMLQADRELTFNTPDLGRQSQYFTRILWSRLCWKVTGVVLLSFIVVELLILVPSALSFRQAFIGNIRDVALASVVPLLPEFSGQNASKDLLLDALEARHPAVLGGALYDREGNLLGNFGVHPEWGAFDFAHNDKTVVEDDDLYSIESYWNGQQISQPYDLVLKIDISSMPYQFFLYICRIGGLILIIAFTLTTMLVLTIGRLVFFHSFTYVMWWRMPVTIRKAPTSGGSRLIDKTKSDNWRRPVDNCSIRPLKAL